MDFFIINILKKLSDYIKDMTIFSFLIHVENSKAGQTLIFKAQTGLDWF